VQLDLITAAKNAYFDLFYKRRTLDDLTRQHELLDQVVQSVRAKLTTNQANQEDVVAAQADLWRLESEILSAQQEVDAAWGNLRSLRGLDTGDSIPSLATPPAVDSPDSVGPWLAAACAHYPPLQRLQQQSISYGFSAAVARRMRLPMLNLQARYGLRTGSDMGVPRDNMLSLQATFSLPIFSGRQQGQMALSMQSMQKSVDAEALQLRRDTEANLRTLHRRVRRLAESLDLYRDRIIPAAEEAYASAMAGYNSSRTSFVSLLTYAVSIYRDRMTANQIANELARAMAEAERYTTDVDAIAGANPTDAR
jgi:outer membrane protein TolC